MTFNVIEGKFDKGEGPEKPLADEVKDLLTQYFPEGLTESHQFSMVVHTDDGRVVLMTSMDSAADVFMTFEMAKTHWIIGELQHG